MTDSVRYRPGLGPILADFSLAFDLVIRSPSRNDPRARPCQQTRTKHGTIIHILVYSNNKPVDYSKWDKLELSDDRYCADLFCSSVANYAVTLKVSTAITSPVSLECRYLEISPPQCRQEVLYPLEATRHSRETSATQARHPKPETLQ